MLQAQQLGIFGSRMIPEIKQHRALYPLPVDQFHWSWPGDNVIFWESPPSVVSQSILLCLVTTYEKGAFISRRPITFTYYYKISSKSMKLINYISLVEDDIYQKSCTLGRLETWFIYVYRRYEINSQRYLLSVLSRNLSLSNLRRISILLIWRKEEKCNYICRSPNRYFKWQTQINLNCF